MKRLIVFTIVFFLFFFNCTTTSGISGESYILMDVDSGRILYGKNIHERHLTASICKIATAMVAIENGDLFERFVVSKSATLKEGSSLYLEEGDEIYLIDLLYGLMMRSGNDAAELISEVTFDSKEVFIQEMNNLAKKLKMTNTTFENPDGLDNENYNYSTAYDMALLMCYAVNNEKFIEISSKENYKATTLKHTYYWLHKHRLISSDYIVSGKTGYTKRSGRTLVTYAVMDNMRLVAVSFNCSDDFNLHNALFNKAKNEFVLENVIKSQVFKQGIDTLDYYPNLANDITFLVKRDAIISAKMFLLVKPQSNYCGFLEIYEDGVAIYRVDLLPYWPNT